MTVITSGSSRSVLDATYEKISSRHQSINFAIPEPFCIVNNCSRRDGEDVETDYMNFNEKMEDVTRMGSLTITKS